MPMTLSHIAAVLPFRNTPRLNFRWFSRLFRSARNHKLQSFFERREDSAAKGNSRESDQSNNLTTLLVRSLIS